MTKLYLIRHGETEGNKNARLCGITNIQLSEKGRKQLDCLAERFRTVKLDRIYSSPLDRAYHTAEAVNRHHGLPVEKVRGLIELNAGDWENVAWSEIRPRDPERYEIWKSDPARYEAPHGEAMRQIFSRIFYTVARLAKECDGMDIALVSHGCALRNFLCHARGWPLSRLGELKYVENTSVTCVTYDGTFHIEYEDDSTHLPDELATVRYQTWWNDFVTVKN